SAHAALPRSLALPLALALGLLSAPARAEQPAAPPDPAALLAAAEANARPYDDMVTTVEMELTDAAGKTEQRVMEMTEKDGDKRLLRFEAPGDIKGLGVLVKGMDTIYVYLPAFGKVRRIASH